MINAYIYFTKYNIYVYSVHTYNECCKTWFPNDILKHTDNIDEAWQTAW